MSFVTHTNAARAAMGDSICSTGSGQLGANFSLVLYTGTVLTGTISIVNGTSSISGSGTSFTTALAVGQVVFFSNDTTSTPYTIASIASNTSATISQLYSGTTLSGSNMESVPLTAQSGLVSNTAASTIPNCNFGASSSGVSTVTSSGSDTSAVGGTVRFLRAKTNGGTTVLQGVISPTGNGGDMQMNTVVIAGGATVALSGTNTYTAAA